MSFIAERTKKFAATSIFPAFFYSVTGWVLAQMAVAQMQSSWRSQVLLGIMNMALPGLLLFRFRIHWCEVKVNILLFEKRAVKWHLLLLAVGACIGAMASLSSVLLLGVVAISTYFIPWIKIPICRAQIIGPSMIMVIGVLGSVVFLGKADQPLHTLLAAWMISIPSMVMYILVLSLLKRSYRISDFGRNNERDASNNILLNE